MADTQKEIDIISHCIKFMSNKEAINRLFTRNGLKLRNSFSYSEAAEIFEASPDALGIDEVTALFRSEWKPCDIERHIGHLKSGLLNGHNWHGARPSFLHRSIQDKVRECSKGDITLEDYLAIGSDIFKHEYFMVATHDICESSIILSDESVIPPIGNKSISDFIYDGIPYDLKVSSHPAEWKDRAGRMTIEEKKTLATELYEGADSERIREDAARCRHNWGLNRMYYLVADQDIWLNDPQSAIDFLIAQLDDPDNCFEINVHGLDIHVCFVEQ